MEKQKETARRIERKRERLEGPPAFAYIETSEVTAPTGETMGTAE